MRPLCHSSNQDSIAIAQDANHILLLQKNDLNRHTYVPTAHTDRVASIKLTDKLLARGGTEGSLSLWDNRQLSGAPIHTFNRKKCPTQVPGASSTRSTSASTFWRRGPPRE